MYTAAKRIKQLRDEGWKVKVRIERPLPVLGMRQPIPVARHEAEKLAPDLLPKEGSIASNWEARGGRVLVRLTPPEATGYVEGESRCNSKLDNFNRKIGLEIALGRAMKILEQAEADKVPEPVVKKITHGIQIGEPS